MDDWYLGGGKPGQAGGGTVTVAAPAGAPAPVEVTTPVMVMFPPGVAGFGVVVTAKAQVLSLGSVPTAQGCPAGGQCESASIVPSAVRVPPATGCGAVLAAPTTIGAACHQGRTGRANDPADTLVEPNWPRSGRGIPAMVGGAAVTPRVSMGRVLGPAKPAPGLYRNVTLDGPAWRACHKRCKPQGSGVACARHVPKAHVGRAHWGACHHDAHWQPALRGNR